MYRERIREEAAKMGRVGTNPVWIEAWMRLEKGCLDGLTSAQFRGEVKMALACIDASTDAENQGLAESFGF